MAFVPSSMLFPSPDAHTLDRIKSERERTMTLWNSNSKPSKNLQELVQDGEMRLKKLSELSEQINQLLEGPKREPLEKAEPS